MSPVSDDDYNADLAAEFGFPLIVVSANVLGTINATLQTLITASTYCEGLEVAGIALNSPERIPDDPCVDSNRDELERRCIAPVLASVEFGGGFDRDVDWWGLCVSNQARKAGSQKPGGVSPWKKTHRPARAPKGRKLV